jgi:hypothetical protein
MRDKAGQLTAFVFAAVLLFSSQCFASIVLIDASVGGTIVFSNNCPGPLSCTPDGYKTPLYNVHAGDIIDLGSVILYPTLTGQGRSQFPIAIWYEGLLGISWGPLVGFSATNPTWFSSCFTAGCTPEMPPIVTERLLFTAPEDATQLQLGFTGRYAYTPPLVTTAVPEPSTWAMLLIGFAGIGFAGYRRQRSKTVSGSRGGLEKGIISSGIGSHF